LKWTPKFGLEEIYLNSYDDLGQARTAIAKQLLLVRRSGSTSDALLFGRVTYEMMEAAWRPPARTGARPDWMEPFARAIDAAKKYVVSSTLDRVDWNAEIIRGDLGKAVQQLKLQSGRDCSWGA
jgi:dihydrofolate reductase